MNWLAETGTEMAWLTPLVTGVIAAVFAGVGGLLYGNNKGKQQADARDVTLRKPVPTIQIREEQRWVDREEFKSHVDRTEGHFERIWEAMEENRNTARESLSKIHKRIDDQSIAVAAVAATTNEVKGTVNKLLDLAIGKTKPNSRA